MWISGELAKKVVGVQPSFYSLSSNSHLHQPLPNWHHKYSFFRALLIVSNQQALPVLMCLGILRQWWHLPVVGGLILDAVRGLYGQLLVRHNEVYLLFSIQEKHILLAKPSAQFHRHYVLQQRCF